MDGRIQNIPLEGGGGGTDNVFVVVFSRQRISQRALRTSLEKQ